MNASPDVREQLNRLHTAPASGETRLVPIEGVVLTDAELDHTLGLALLREARHLPLYATAAVQSILHDDSRLLPVTRHFSDVPVTELPLHMPIALTYRDSSASPLSVEAFPVAAGPPRFASRDERGHTVGLLIREHTSDRACAFVPGCGDLDATTLAELSRAHSIFFDGTFWSDDELIARGVGDRTARELDHVPIAGRGGSLEQLASLSPRQRVYTHINNTNPILLEQSPEHDAVARAGITVGFDGLRVTV